jgi:hypothetical protein
MVNPAAPAKYGSGRDFVTPRDAAAQQARNGHIRAEAPGIRLLSFSF